VPPSAFPSSAPSTVRDGFGIWQFLDVFSFDVDLIEALKESNRNESTDEGLSETPQFLAANWIINEDLLELEQNDPKLAQRFALAVLYFSTSNSTFLNDGDECEWDGFTCDDVNSVVTEIDFFYNYTNGHP